MTAQKIAASQTATQRKHTGRLARHFKLSVLAGLSAGTREKRLQAVSAVALHPGFEAWPEAASLGCKSTVLTLML